LFDDLHSTDDGHPESLRQIGGDRAVAAPGPAGEGQSRKWLILVAVSLGMMLGIFNIALVNIAVPALMRDLNSSVTGVSWVLNAFNITSAVLLLSFGRLADRFGPRRVFLISISVFTLFSLACGFAHNVEQLIAFRIVQGIGSAGIVPVSLVILLRSFPAEERGLATGTWGAFGQVAAILGAPVGGLLIGTLSWHWIFFMNVPLGVAAAVMSFLVVPNFDRQREVTGLDLPGIGLSAGSLFCLTLAIIQGNKWGWSSGRVLGLFGSFVVGLAVFAVWESRARNPMLDLRLLRIRAFSTATGMSVLGGVGMAAGSLMLILFMINVLGYSETKAAIVMIPTSGLTLVLSPFAGRLVDVIGPRYLAAAGSLLFAVGFSLFATLRADATVMSIVWRAMFIGAGMAVNMPSVMAAGLTAVPVRSNGVGSGMMNTGQQVGNVIGLTVLLAIYAHGAIVGTAATVTDASAHVMAQQALSPALKEEAVRLVQQNADRHGVAQAEAGAFFQPADGLAATLAGKTDAANITSLEADIEIIAKQHSARAYAWSFLVGGLAALLNLPFAFQLGRRLGDTRVSGRKDSRAAL
jgi:EmrB/QacA subfamily drug resistance transporter